MKRTIIYTLFLLSFVCQQANATHIVQNQYDSSLNQSEHMSWWTHDRFGLFIHWGLYAMPARHEWVKSREKMSDEHYNRYKNLFNPDLYNPREQVQVLSLQTSRWELLKALLPLVRQKTW